MWDACLMPEAKLQEPVTLLRGAEAHHVLDARAVVPTAVKDDDFARGGKMCEVALDVHLGFFAVRRRG